MAIAARELVGLADARETEAFVRSRRWGVESTINMWHNDIQTSRDLFAGKMTVRLPDGTALSRLTIENLYHDNIEDAKRLVAEDPGTLYLDILGTNDEAENDTLLEEAVARGYWSPRDSERVERRVMDYISGGAMFLLSSADSNRSKYPFHTKLDPMGCYPTFGEQEDELADFLYVTSVNARAIAMEYSVEKAQDAAAQGVRRPVFRIDPKKTDGLVDEFTYLSPTRMIRAVSYATSQEDRGQITILEDKRNEIGRVPVSFAVEWNPDGSIQIPFLQVLDVMKFNNTAMGMLQHHLEKGIYAPLWVRGEVDTSEYGAEGEVRGVGNDSEAHPMQPAQMDPAFFGITGRNDQAARGGMAYPAQRQGQNLPSIGSGAMIAAISGERASLIRYFQRKEASLRRQCAEIDRLLDVKYLDFNKSLRSPAPDRKTYTPSQVWKKDYECEFRVVFGSEGLPSLDRRVAIQGDVGLGLMAKDTARRLNPNIPNPKDEERRIFVEEATRVIFQETLATLPPQAQLMFIAKMRKDGMHPLDAASALLEHPELLQPPAAPGELGPPGTPGPVPAGQSAQDAALAVQKGGAPGNEFAKTLAPESQKPPLQNVLVNLRSQ